jgi:putative sugar O-methyltransferase
MELQYLIVKMVTERLLRMLSLILRFFSTFKSSKAYTRILEHLKKDVGQKYLEIVKGMSPELMTRSYFSELAKQDSIGGPHVDDFGPPVFTLSPTLLRYWKCVSDVSWLFGDLDGKRVLEIGVGYGGLAHAMFNRWGGIASYTLVDMPPVEQLANKVLKLVRPSDSDKIILWNTAQEPTNANTSGYYDLCISNYAFSDLTEKTADNTHGYSLALQRRLLDLEQGAFLGRQAQAILHEI